MIYLRHHIISYSHSLFCCRSVFAYIAPTSEFKTQNWTIWSTPMRWATNSSHFRYSFVRSLARGGNSAFGNICSNAKHYCQQFLKELPQANLFPRWSIGWIQSSFLMGGDSSGTMMKFLSSKEVSKRKTNYKDKTVNNNIEWYHKRMANYTKWYQLICHVLACFGILVQNRHNLRYWASLQAALSVLV